MDQQQELLLDELLSNQEFKNWVINPNDGDSSNQWAKWAEQSQEHAQCFEIAQELIISFYKTSSATPQATIAKKVHSALNEAKRIERTNTQKLFSYAAVAIIAIGLFIGYLIQNNKPVANAEEILQPNPHEIDHSRSVNTIRNTSSTIKHLQLPDGSSVILQQEAVITFPSQFTDAERRVTLQGKAFFEVVKNKNQPFIVEANNVTIQVVGTSFHLNTNATQTQVIVKSGEVKINRHTDPDITSPTILTANQQAIFADEKAPSQVLEEIAVDLPISMLSFNYDHTPLKTVLQDLEKAYGVTIEVDSTRIQNCTVSAELSDEPLQQKLEWLSIITNASITMNENHILFKALPCQ